jgi:hemoglobin/transferrin/lactoferrin receptor protein
MIKKVTACLLACCVLPCAAQTIFIIDHTTGEPVPGANIIAHLPEIVITTNARGEADISKLRGKRILEVQATSYRSRLFTWQQLDSASFRVSLSPFAAGLDEIVISGSRWSRELSRSPSKIIRITPREVALLNPQTSADMLALTGKVYVQKSQQGGGSPMIRGFATNRLLYVVDGVRMNTASFRAGNIQNVINIDPFALQSAEVMFGPGSVLYGSDAIGGVMTFNTLTPQLSTSDSVLITGNAVARYSSANKESTGHFDVNLGWRKWALVTSISSWTFDHLRQGSHGPQDYVKPYFVQRSDSVDHVVSQVDPLLQIPSGYSQVNLMQKVRFMPVASLDLQYAFHFSETSPYGRFDRHLRVRKSTARYAEWNYGPQSWLMHQVSLTHDARDFVYDKVSLKLALQKFGESRTDRALNSDIRLNQLESVDAWSVNLDLQKSLGTKHVLSYGAEYVLNDVVSRGVETDISTGEEKAAPSRYPLSDWSSMAVYLNNEWRLNDKFTLQAAVRYTMFQLKAKFDTTLVPLPFTSATMDNDALTGSLGFAFAPTHSWLISASLASAFRAPNVDDMGKFFDSEPGTVTVPNPGLGAEQAYSADAAVSKVFFERVKLEVAGFYTLLENALVRREYTLNGADSIVYNGDMSRVLAIQNAAHARVYGFQGSIDISLPSGFGLSSSWNWQKGEEELDDGSISPLRHASPAFGMSRARYERGRIALQVYAMYQVERKNSDLPEEEKAKVEMYAKDAAGNNYAPYWYTLNFKTLLKTGNNVLLQAGIENITDQRYRPYSSGISGAGRNFIIGASVKF